MPGPPADPPTLSPGFPPQVARAEEDLKAKVEAAKWSSVHQAPDIALPALLCGVHLGGGT